MAIYVYLHIRTYLLHYWAYNIIYITFVENYIHYYKYV